MSAVKTERLDVEQNMNHFIAMTQWIVGDEPLEVSCRRLRDCGYDGIEFAAEPEKLNADECSRLLGEYGLECHSLCGIFDESRDLTSAGEAGKNAVRYIRKSVDFAVRVGAKVLIVVPSPVGRTVPPADSAPAALHQNAVRNLREAGEYAGDHGVRLAIEAINRYETYLINTVENAYQMAAEVDLESVGVMADLFHMSIEEASFADSLAAISDRLMHVHIADNTREPAGMGHTDFKEILRVLDRVGYSGSLTMEFMYRLADPYGSRNVRTDKALMDRYAKQAIDFIKLCERSVSFGK